MIKDKVYDDQTKNLARNIWIYFMQKFTLDDSERAAFNRLSMSMDRGKNMDSAMHRNTIFKAAHALGMKLPSSIF